MGEPILKCRFQASCAEDEVGIAGEMDRRSAEGIFASDDTCIGPISDERVLQLAAAIQHPTLQYALGQSEVASVEPPGSIELRIPARIGPEDPVGVKSKYGENQYKKRNS